MLWGGEGAHVVFLVAKSHPETAAGAGTWVLCTQNMSAVTDEPSPMAAVNLVIFYSLLACVWMK